jgi:hypothetical protein
MKKKNSKPDWILLARFGLPISIEQHHVSKINIHLLINQIIKAALFLDNYSGNDYGHYKDALRALIFTIKTHYPSTYKLLSVSPICKKMLKNAPNGKDLKLRNIVLAKISKYI